MATDPVCGMYVDERSATLRLNRDNRTYYFCASSCLESFAAPAHERARLRRQLAVGAVGSAIVVFVTYVIHPTASLLLAAVPATVVQAYLGYPFYRGTWDALRSGVGNMDVLIAVGTSAAYGYSVASWLLPGTLPSAAYFDASCLILTLILAGNYIERTTRERAGGAVRALGELVPARAWRLRDGREESVAVGDLEVGDRVRVRAGERFPVDGIVRAGRSEVEESILTGEDREVVKGPGSKVVAGSRNGDAPLDIETSLVGPDTFIAQIGTLVAEAETSRVPLQAFADRVAAAFVPTVLMIGIGVSVGWALLGHVGFPQALLIFVSVVIIACPCAFGLATPAAILAGTGRAAQDGVLFRGGDALERAARVDLVVMDKTGTLTTGTPRVATFRCAPGADESAALALAAGLAAASDHPLSRAIRAYAAERGVSATPIDGLTAAPGVGLEGRSGEEAVSLRRLDESAPGLPPFLREGIDAETTHGESLSVLRRGDRALAVVGFTPELAAGAAESIAALRHDGIRVVMATGDRESAARSVAGAVGIDEVHAALGPADKLALIERLRREGRHVGFVGDGVNDAAALAAADAGIAIATGTEVAKEAGQILLVRPDLRGVSWSLRIARRTVAKVRQNVAWAVGYNATLLPVAAGALVPALGLGIYAVLPIAGAAAMGLSSTGVLLNSLSLRWGPGEAPGTRARPERVTPTPA